MAKKLLGAPGIATRSKEATKLLGAPGLTIRSKKLLGAKRLTNPVWWLALGGHEGTKGALESTSLCRDDGEASCS